MVLISRMNDSGSDTLSTKLRSWKVEPTAPSSFQREVWQRIAARQTIRDEAFWPQVAQWMFAQIARPRYAVSLVALSLSMSIGVAFLQAKDTNLRQWKNLEARYVSSIDPLEMTR